MALETMSVGLHHPKAVLAPLEHLHLIHLGQGGQRVVHQGVYQGGQQGYTSSRLGDGERKTETGQEREHTLYKSNVVTVSLSANLEV